MPEGENEKFSSSIKTFNFTSHKLNLQVEKKQYNCSDANTSHGQMLHI